MPYAILTELVLDVKVLDGPILTTALSLVPQPSALERVQVRSEKFTADGVTMLTATLATCSSVRVLDLVADGASLFLREATITRNRSTTRR